MRRPICGPRRSTRRWLIRLGLWIQTYLRSSIHLTLLLQRCRSTLPLQVTTSKFKSETYLWIVHPASIKNWMNVLESQLWLITIYRLCLRLTMSICHCQLSVVFLTISFPPPFCPSNCLSSCPPTSLRLFAWLNNCESSATSACSYLISQLSFPRSAIIDWNLLSLLCYVCVVFRYHSTYRYFELYSRERPFARIPIGIAASLLVAGPVRGIVARSAASAPHLDSLSQTVENSPSKIHLIAIQCRMFYLPLAEARSYETVCPNWGIVTESFPWCAPLPCRFCHSRR